MINENNHRINCVIPKYLHKAFISAYPSCLSHFIRNALALAVQDKKYFDMIFFKDLRSE